MTQMLIGIALVCLEMTLTHQVTVFGYEITMIISLLPDFVGYILLILGQRKLAHENDHFYKNIKFSLWCGTVALMVFIMDLIGTTARGDFQSILLQMLLMVLEPICLFRIVRGIRQVEKDYEVDLKGKILFGVWLAMTIMSVVAFFASFFEGLGNIAGLILSILSFAYIALFFNFKLVYEEIGISPEDLEEEE